MIYALDTNIIIDLLNGKSAAMTKQFNDTVKNKTPIIIPPLVNYEVLRGFYRTPSLGKETAYRNMCSNCPVGEMNSVIWNRAALIYAALHKSGHTVGDADILIAAFCIINDYTLVTWNTKDFKNISGLQLINWSV